MIDADVLEELFLDAVEQLELYCPNPDVWRQLLEDAGLDPDYSPLDDSSRKHRWAL